MEESGRGKRGFEHPAIQRIERAGGEAEWIERVAEAPRDHSAKSTKPVVMAMASLMRMVSVMPHTLGSVAAGDKRREVLEPH